MDYDSSQLMRGTLEGCMLKIISLAEVYGYELAHKLTEYGFADIKEGTIYPLLIRLEKRGLISSAMRPSPLGPARKYYRLTATGADYLRSFTLEWDKLAHSVNCILEATE